jgi:hypothetical protein
MMTALVMTLVVITYEVSQLTDGDLISDQLGLLQSFPCLPACTTPSPGHRRVGADSASAETDPLEFSETSTRPWLPDETP